MTDNYDNDDIDGLICVSITHETRIIRVMGNLLVPSKMTIRAELSASEDATQNVLSEILLKIRVWYDQIVAHSVAFASDNYDALTMFYDQFGEPRTDNHIMLTPASPTDDLLATVFQAKMQALAGKYMEFGLCEVKSDNVSGLTFTFFGDPLTVLPSMNDWIGERRYFNEPWWNRDDASTLDTVPPPDADLKEKPSYAKPLLTAMIPAPIAPPVIIKPVFRPKVINNGDETDE